MTKRARVKISYDLITELLQLPGGITIRRVIPPNYAMWDPTYTELILEGEALPVEAVSEGVIIPEVQVVVTDDAEGQMVPKVHIRFEALA